MMKKFAKGLSCVMAICLLTSGIGFAAAESTAGTTRMPNGYVSGLKSGLKNGAKNGLVNGASNGLAGGLKDGAKSVESLAAEMVEERIGNYKLPELADFQKKILEKYIPQEWNAD